MNCRYFAEINIGGTIYRDTLSKVDPKKTVLERLVKEVRWSSVKNNPSNVDDLLSILHVVIGVDSEEKEEKTRTKHLTVSDKSAVNGELISLIAFCHTEELPYMHRSEGNPCGCDQMIFWTPEMKEPSVVNTIEGDVCVDGSKARMALVMLKSYMMREAINILEDLCPNTPEIPKFEIVNVSTG